VEANINVITLYGIAISLVSTIRVREECHIEEKRHLKECIAQLKAQIKAHKDNFQWCPEGYIKNTKYTDLTMAISNGLYHPTK
jgi:hypothetical protein